MQETPKIRVPPPWAKPPGVGVVHAEWPDGLGFVLEIVRDGGPLGEVKVRVLEQSLSVVLVAKMQMTEGGEGE